MEKYVSLDYLPLVSFYLLFNRYHIEISGGLGPTVGKVMERSIFPFEPSLYPVLGNLGYCY